jgi:hypothetical protein
MRPQRAAGIEIVESDGGLLVRQPERQRHHQLNHTAPTTIGPTTSAAPTTIAPSTTAFPTTTVTEGPIPTTTVTKGPIPTTVGPGTTVGPHLTRA